MARGGIRATSDLLSRLIARKRGLMRATMIAERLWPLLLPALCVAGLFVALSWFGFFRAVPDWARIATFIVFLAGFFASLIGLRTFRQPSAAEIDRRLEAINGIRHQAISVQDDHLENDTIFARALWREHRARMADKIANLQTGLPDPDTARRDPYGLRAAVVLLLVTAFGYSYSNQAGYLTDAFHSHEDGVAVAEARIDAWVTPPTYTGRAPIFLTQGEIALPDRISVPEGSEVTVRITGGSGGGNVTFEPEDGSETVAIGPVTDGAETPNDVRTTGQDAGQEPAQAEVYAMTAETSGRLSVGGLQDGQAWTFDIVADTPPIIAFEDDPRRAINGALELTYTINDDYGVTEAFAKIVPLDDGGPDTRPLFEAPDYPLTMPRRSRRAGKAVTSRDLTDHPMAGSRVQVTLIARDATGQEGRSDPHEMVLPGRSFSEPLAAAVVEQRRVFSLDANRVQRALDLADALTIAPEETIPNLTHFLLLKSARGRVAQAFNDDMLRDASEYLWQVALQIEDGDLSLAERRLRDAQRALAEALENGATDEEIQSLMEELRQAMADYMRELAESMQNNEQAMQMPPQGMENMLRQQDLDRMLDQIENLARSGQRDQAQQLLNELQRMMNNLQAGRMQQQQMQGSSPMREQMDKLGELMQRQQQLMDQTFNLDQALRDRMQRGDPQRRPGEERQQGQQGQQGQQQPQQGQNGQQSQQGQGLNGMSSDELREALRQLREQQQALQEQLGQMQEDLEALGMEPGEGFGEAGEAMGDAAGSLGEGQGEQAVGEQGRALEALRRGAQDMMNQMMQAMGQGEGDGNGQAQGPTGRDDRDPLGRPRSTTGPDFGESVKVPDEIDIQRAREILEEIRRRLGDALSPDMEKRYLERLLDIQ